MYLWKWLTDFRWKYHAPRWFNLTQKSRNIHLLYLIMSNDRLLNLFYQADLENALRELIREADGTNQKDLIKYVAYTLLGKMHFEKGLMPIAYNHFKEALKHLTNTKYDDKEEEARLKAWLGLIALKIGEFREAVDLLRDSVDIVESIFGRGELLGELKVLLADALYFVDSNEAVQVAEDAHEILKQFATPLYLSNAIKLTAALAARKYNNEASSILREAFDRYSKLIFTFNVSFIKTIKAIEANSKKMLFYIDPTTSESTLDMIVGLEGLKGSYYIYRRSTKLNFPSIKLLNINKNIVKALSKRKNPEDLLNTKKRHMERIEERVISGTKPKPIYSINAILDNLLENFGKIGIISFIEGDESHIYRLSYYELPSKIVKSKIIEIGDEILEAQELTAIEASVLVERSIPKEILSQLKQFGEQDLLIISVDGKLSAVPWDLIPIDTDNGNQYLGLRTNIVYVPTIYEMSFWEKRRDAKFEMYYYFSSRKLGKKTISELESIISECGYSPIKNINNLIERSLDVEIDILILCDDGIESPDDDVYFKFGKNYLSMMDLEKVAFKGNLAVVCTRGSLQSVKDSVGIHNPTFSFLMSGYRAVLGYIGSEVNVSEFIDFLLTFFKEESEPIYKRMFNSKQILAKEAGDWWRFQLYGNPFVRIL